MTTEHTFAQKSYFVGCKPHIDDLWIYASIEICVLEFSFSLFVHLMLIFYLEMV